MVNETPESGRADAPSAGWGWHGRFRRGPVVAGWFTVLFFLGIVIDRFASGHFISHTPDAVLIAIAVVLSSALIRHSVRARRSPQRWVDDQ